MKEYLVNVFEIKVVRNIFRCR